MTHTLEYPIVIIDTHQHLGRSMFSGVETTESELLAAMDEHAVNVMLVMPQPSQEDASTLHDHIAESVARHPTRLYGMASINPWCSDIKYETEARRCVKELGFVAIKLHPLGHNLPPTHAEADKVFRTAAELGVPVLVHTGMGEPWALPSLCITPARRYPQLPIILAHAGWGVYSAEAIVAAEVCENIYLEPSWCPAYMVRQMIDKFGTGRLVFGSDHLTNLPVELTKFRSIGLSDAELDEVFAKTPHRLFGLA